MLQALEQTGSGRAVMREQDWRMICMRMGQVRGALSRRMEQAMALWHLNQKLSLSNLMSLTFPHHRTFLRLPPSTIWGVKET